MNGLPSEVEWHPGIEKLARPEAVSDDCSDVVSITVGKEGA